MATDGRGTNWRGCYRVKRRDFELHGLMCPRLCFAGGEEACSDNEGYIQDYFLMKSFMMKSLFLQYQEQQINQKTVQH